MTDAFTNDLPLNASQRSGALYFFQDISILSSFLHPQTRFRQKNAISLPTAHQKFYGASLLYQRSTQIIRFLHFQREQIEPENLRAPFLCAPCRFRQERVRIPALARSRIDNNDFLAHAAPTFMPAPCRTHKLPSAFALHRQLLRHRSDRRRTANQSARRARSSLPSPEAR